MIVRLTINGKRRVIDATGMQMAYDKYGLLHIGDIAFDADGTALSVSGSAGDASGIYDHPSVVEVLSEDGTWAPAYD